MIRLLCLADVHLGRGAPSCTPDELDFTYFTPRKAWEEAIAFAIAPQNGIDAVLFAGDLVNQNDLFFETTHTFEKGIRQILESGIEVVAVAGNHDAIVFRKLVRSISSPKFHLLGQNEKWESVILTIKNKTVRFDGWSFAETHAPYNPLKQYPTIMPKADFSIGLLHCDCPAPLQSNYAPVNVSDFYPHSPHAWVLGHIHKSIEFSNHPLIFYCGSLQGLDPSEEGNHGGHLLEINSSGNINKSLVSFAKVRWEKISLDFSDLPLDLFEETLMQKLHTLHQTLKQENPYLYAVGCRLQLHGRTAAFKKIPALLEKVTKKILLSQPSLKGNEVSYFIEKVENLTQPDYPLASLSEHPDPAGLLAKYLIELQNNPNHPLFELAVKKAQAALEKHPQFADLSLSAEKCRELLVQAGFQSLDLLLSQKETARET